MSKYTNIIVASSKRLCALFPHKVLFSHNPLAQEFLPRCVLLQHRVFFCDPLHSFINPFFTRPVPKSRDFQRAAFLHWNMVLVSLSSLRFAHSSRTSKDKGKDNSLPSPHICITILTLTQSFSGPLGTAPTLCPCLCPTRAGRCTTRPRTSTRWSRHYALGKHAGDSDEEKDQD